MRRRPSIWYVPFNMHTIIFFALLTLSSRAVLAQESAPPDLAALERQFESSLADFDYWQALAYADLVAAAPQTAAARRSEVLRKAGELRLLLGDFPGAAEDFRNAMGGNPRASDLLNLAEAKREQPEEALPYAERAAKAPDAAAFDRAKANLLAAALRMDMGDASGAEKNLALALTDAPDDLDALSAMVRLKRENKPAARAYAERAERAAAKTPPWQRPAAYRFASRIWLEIGEHERAAEKLRSALRLNPEDLEALAPLVRMKDKLTPKQLAGFQRSALVSDADKEAAAKSPSADAVNRALAANPHDLEALRQLLVLNRSNPAAATSHAARFADSVRKSPVWHRAEADRVLAAFWLSVGNEGKAYATLDHAYEFQTNSIAAWRMFLKMPKLAPADEHRSGALSAYCNAAELRLALGDREGAQETAKLGLKLDPTHACALRILDAAPQR